MQQPVAAEELELAKQSWATAQRNRLADDAAIAGDLAEGLYLGRTMLFDKHIQDRVSTLDGASLLKALESCFSGQAWVQIAAGDITE
jgi:predicted Zn-dependent peptidase